VRNNAYQSGASGFTNGTRNAKQASKKKTTPIKRASHQPLAAA
jgi:hypothetical protein